MKYHYLIVGTGFAGATLARKLADDGKKVLIIDRRNHIGGNSYDYYNEFGVLVHKYGPHYFRTNRKDVWDFLSNFTEWRYYQYVVKTFVDGQLFDLPINLNTINQFYCVNLSSFEVKDFLERIKVKIEKPQNCEEQVLSQVGRDIYEKFFKNYTIKQWKTDPKNLDPSITARIPVRFNRDPRYFSDYYQAMPKYGYHKLFDNLLHHENITIELSTDYYEVKNSFKFENLIYTGCIDEFFNFKFGNLGYRSLSFEFETFNQEYYQGYSQVNYPNEYDFTRIVEIKHATGQNCDKTTIVREYPQEIGEPYYPILTLENSLIYEQYLNEARQLDNVYFVGRLAQFKYLNMDQAVKEAFCLYNHLKK